MCSSLDVGVAGVIHCVNAVLQRLFVKINHIAHFTVLQHEVGVELLLEELAILGDTLKFEDYAVINYEVEAQVVLQTLALVKDRNRHLALHMKALCREFLGGSLFVDALQKAWPQLAVYLVEALQQAVCVVSIHFLIFMSKEFRRRGVLVIQKKTPQLLDSLEIVSLAKEFRGKGSIF